jgi:hypothetical protein
MWTTAEVCVTRSKSPCTHTKKLFLSRLEHLGNSWGTHYQKQVSLHWHKEISAVQTAACGQQLRYPSPEPGTLHSHKEISSVQTASPGQQLRYPHQKSCCTQSKKLIQSRLQHVDNSWGTHHQKPGTLHWRKGISSVQTAPTWQKLRYRSPETRSAIPSTINYKMNIQLLHLCTQRTIL